MCGETPEPPVQPQEIRRRAFVLRVWQDETGRVWGLISEPMKEWQVPFSGLDRLWAILMDRLNIPVT